MKSLRKSFRTASSAERKQFPIFEGVLAYFPDALARVAEISYMGNAKHNPGEPLHWSRQKSSDHKDCAARHLVQSQWEDSHPNDDEEDHLAEAAWRILAALQLREEKRYKLRPAANALDTAVTATVITDPHPIMPGSMSRRSIFDPILDNNNEGC